MRKAETILGWLFALGLGAGLAGAGLADAADPDAIQVLAENCQICHGPMGQGAGAMKAIGGRPASELQPLLTGFRDGTTPSTLMWRLMKPLSDAEIAALAAEVASWK